MTFLPIVGRELRVAARQRFTYWSRLLAALLILILFGALQTIFFVSSGMTSSAGQIEFGVLKWIVFVAASFAGVFLTSDSLSEEKREGTLGLLFLTDLRGYDVVLGKLLSQSLRAFYCLLAVLPVMALAILNGGVTGPEFARVVLVICNTLFLSLALGLLVSSFSREAIKAMTTTLLAAVVLVSLPALLDTALAHWDETKFQPHFSIISPVYLFAVTRTGWPPGYWPWLGLQHLLAWIYLLVASLRVPRAWQEKASVEGVARTKISNRWRFGGPRHRLALRHRLLARDPILWLALRDRWLPRLVVVCAVGMLLAQGWMIGDRFRELSLSSSGLSFGIGFQIGQMVSVLFSFVLMLWVVSQASRFFIEGIRNGALELLLVTPVTPAQLVRQQWAALWRTFAFPTVVMLLLQTANGILNILQFQKSIAASMAAAKKAGGTTTFTGLDHFTGTQILGIGINALTLVAGLAALAWFGMWAGLTTRKNVFAILKAICFVSVLPGIAFIVCQMILSVTLWRLFPTGGAQMWGNVIVTGLLSLGKDALFIWWARRRLLAKFREVAAAGGQVPRRRWRKKPPPSLAPPVAVPATP